MTRVLLATRNPGKLRELRELTADTDLHWIGLADFPDVPDAVEDGTTFADNARRKARHYARLTGLPALADDSGLEVDCLDGAPGVDSAHYAGPQRDDVANNRKLIDALRGVPPERRTARFRCHMTLARGDHILAESDGAVAGRIIDDARGENGFGYDPHFFIPELHRTTAELPSDEKNSISHRGQALRAILPQVIALLNAK